MDKVKEYWVLMWAGHESVAKGNAPGLNLFRVMTVLVLLMLPKIDNMLPENKMSSYEDVEKYNI